MNDYYLLLMLPTLIVLELLYFRIARKYKILDKPNDRSMHEKLTIRGGGFIFCVAPLIYFVFTGQPGYLFITGLTLIGFIGLADDIKGLSRLLRFSVQGISVLLLFYQLNFFLLPIWAIFIVFIIVTGTINAYNFMDGINGITGGYSLVVMTSLFYINREMFLFVDNGLLLVVIISLLVFNFFNFRNKAVCFAGDAGSLSMGFIVIYLVMKLIYSSHNFGFILLLGVYGVDSVLTIVHRLILRENIFKPHRWHLYQVIVARTKISHLQMTAIYMTVQVLFSFFVIHFASELYANQYRLGLLLILGLALLYVGLKFYFLKL